MSKPKGCDVRRNGKYDPLAGDINLLSAVTLGLIKDDVNKRKVQACDDNHDRD